jgi:hypothetical protein
MPDVHENGTYYDNVHDAHFTVENVYESDGGTVLIDVVYDEIEFDTTIEHGVFEDMGGVTLESID